jgi:hypothetical protein
MPHPIERDVLRNLARAANNRPVGDTRAVLYLAFDKDVEFAACATPEVVLDLLDQIDLLEEEIAGEDI